MYEFLNPKDACGVVGGGSYESLQLKKFTFDVMEIDQQVECDKD